MAQKTVHHTTIPAQPGWAHCTPILDDDHALVIDIYEAPVIAWVVTAQVTDDELDACWAQAVVADEFTSPRKTQYLKRPDGLYISQDCGWYKTREDLIEAMQEDARTAARRLGARHLPQPKK